jgi:site-specific DNA-methyltransferase (adenine-specific)
VTATSVHYSRARNDWETPPELFAEYDEEFHFTLDVCATEFNRKCLLYIDGERDGLVQPWEGATCWMNPPYGTAVAKWMEKAWAESRLGATVVCLVPARTDTAWWHDYAMRSSEIRFIRGRIGFIRADGHRSRAPFPSAVVIFRARRG